MRWLYEGGPDSEENPEKRFARIVKGLCEAYCTDFSLEFIPSSPTVINDARMVALVKKAAEKVVGRASDVVDYVCMAGEDFGEFGLKAPGALYFIGAGSKEKQTDWPHHHPRFNIDEDALVLGVEMHVRTALLFLTR